MIILSLLSPSCNKGLQLNKAITKRIKIIFDQFVAMFIMLIIILIVLSTSVVICILLSLFGHLKPNLILVRLKSVHKRRQEEIKIIFYVAKCDKIFDGFSKWLH
jgi:hypothetical protein